MEVTYKRDIFHLPKEPSPYVKRVTVKEVFNAFDADTLDVVRFEETGWQAVVRRDSLKVGDGVLFIPPESVLPFELTEALEITKYTSKGRIKVSVLRGNRSEGLVADPAVVEPYLPYILKWEDPPDDQMGGDALPRTQIPLDFVGFYKMPNLLNEPHTFRVGETIYWSEKIHGTNGRGGLMCNPETDTWEVYAGSHNLVLKEDEKVLYWRVFREATKGKELPRGVQFFFEAFGRGIQKNFDYGTMPKLRVFAITIRGEYQNPKVVTQMCNELGLECVTFHETEFKDIQTLKDIADGESELWDGIREGIVVVSDEYPGRMAKVIGFNYLKNKKDDTTERH